MGLALQLARRGKGRVSPNPMVGAVVVKNGQIVGRGFHRRPGEPHAEVLALRQAGEQARGATLYLNLEPCCIHGRTPPCTEEIIRQGLARVVCSHIDPNPRVCGGGLAHLRDQGIAVKAGLLEAQGRALNEVYIKHITTGIPFVILKIAQTLDGKIATQNGDSRWVSSPESRRLTHRMRAQVDAVMVGVNTVLQDDPLLTVRHVKGSNPIKIILDSRLRTPLGAKILAQGRVIMATCQGADSARVQEYRDRRIEVWEMPRDATGLVDLAELLRQVGQAELTSVLIEGGQRILTSALKAGVVDKMHVFIAPSLVGEGKSSIGDLAIHRMADALSLREISVRRVGIDLLVTGRL
jgi:diaminohydroxyphosphoribosylaminopyrimidine deaminase/5-amino-6-(5-phosphoribosylamino)uracil reductase